MSLDVGLLRGVLTAVLFAAFIGLWVWAWKKERKPEFDRIALLPLEDGGPSIERNEQQS